jgi:hypothetical protein
MTLLLTAASFKNVVQVSDRRLTIPKPGFAPGIFDDQANKAIYLECDKANFGIAYTGIAFLGPCDTDHRTDWYILRFLADLKAHTLDAPAIVTKLKEHLTDRMRALGWKEALTLSLAGFIFPFPDRYKPFAVCISNFEDPKTLTPGPVLDQFRDGWFFLKGAEPMVESAYLLHGTRHAVDGQVEADLLKMYADGTLGQENPQKIVEALVSIIRGAADHPTYGTYIGKDCMTLTILPDPEGSTESVYHPFNASPVSYGPHVLRRNGMCFGGVEFGVS